MKKMMSWIVFQTQLILILIPTLILIVTVMLTQIRHSTRSICSLPLPLPPVVRVMEEEICASFAQRRRQMHVYCNVDICIRVRYVRVS